MGTLDFYTPFLKPPKFQKLLVVNTGFILIAPPLKNFLPTPLNPSLLFIHARDLGTASRFN